jgi:hypothetical protein
MAAEILGKHPELFLLRSVDLSLISSDASKNWNYSGGLKQQSLVIPLSLF